MTNFLREKDVTKCESWGTAGHHWQPLQGSGAGATGHKLQTLISHFLSYLSKRSDLAQNFHLFQNKPQKVHFARRGGTKQGSVVVIHYVHVTFSKVKPPFTSTFISKTNALERARAFSTLRKCFRHPLPCFCSTMGEKKDIFFFRIAGSERRPWPPADWSPRQPTLRAHG